MIRAITILMVLLVFPMFSAITNNAIAGLEILKKKCVRKNVRKIMDSNKNQVSHGLATDCHPNGVWKMYRQWSRGKLHGKTLIWYKNGKKKTIENYKNGKYHGKQMTWYEKEGLRPSKEQSVKKEGNYLNGRKHGKQIWLDKMNEVGQIRKIKEENYAHGKKHGKFIIWGSFVGSYASQQKKKTEENYAHGKKHGKQIQFQWSGRHKSCAIYNQGNYVKRCKKQPKRKKERPPWEQDL